jgi:hypothetical protein
MEIIIKIFRKSLLILCFFVGFVSFSNEKLSPSAEISILTCGPHEELYSAFGHSAIRIKDLEHEFDWVYNYGTFDFSAPNFYLNFTKGNQNYYLSRDEFNDFAYFYYSQQRWVQQQVLNLNDAQKQKLYDFLEVNILPENRNYSYEFFDNNCATKIVDVFTDLFEEVVVFYEKDEQECKTIRSLIKEYTKKNVWGQFGIDLVLGSKIDRIAYPREYVFLPDYLLEFFENSAIQKDGFSQSLVSKTYFLLKPLSKNVENNFFTPKHTIYFISFFIFLITLLDIYRKKRTKLLDVGLLFVTGLLGMLMILLWFFTNHTTTVNNFNILWAFPLNVIAAIVFLNHKSIRWQAPYFLFLLLLLIAFFFVWLFQLQEFNDANTFLLIALFARLLFTIFAIRKLR